jgi:hypothetical protein
MQRFSFFALLILVVSALGLASCRKTDEPGYRYNLPAGVQRIVPADLIDTLRRKGMIIHEGVTPPALDGAFRASPYELLTPYGPEDAWRRGKVIPDYKFRFYDQSDDRLAIKMDKKQPLGNDVSTGLGAFVAGSDQTFTIFAEISGQTGNATYTHLAVLSGELTPQGIRNFQYAFLLKEKNDPDDDLIAVGKTRVWRDGDGFAAREAVFRRAAEEALRQTTLTDAGVGSRR